MFTSGRCRAGIPGQAAGELGEPTGRGAARLGGAQDTELRRGPLPAQGVVGAHGMRSFGRGRKAHGAPAQRTRNGAARGCAVGLGVRALPPVPDQSYSQSRAFPAKVGGGSQTPSGDLPPPEGRCPAEPQRPPAPRRAREWSWLGAAGSCARGAAHPSPGAPPCSSPLGSSSNPGAPCAAVCRPPSPRGALPKGPLCAPHPDLPAWEELWGPWATP